MQVLEKPDLLSERPYGPLESVSPEEDQPNWLWRGRVPCLDGLRAVSILLVLIAHAARTRGFPAPTAVSEALIHLGSVGVSIFFVISGFLITLLLARERARQGTISLRDFYLRRAFRIFPAYLTYLLVILVLSLLDYVHPSGKDWLLVLTYTGSIFRIGTWELGHMWSLAIEEQFYLLWPFLMLVLGPRRSGIVAAGCVLLTLLARVISVKLTGSLGNYSTLTRMDCIALGCFLAIAVTEPSFYRILRFLPREGVWPGIFAAVGLVLSYALTTREVAHLLLPDGFGLALLNAIRGKYAIIANAVNAVLVCVIIWSFCRHKERLPGRILESRPLVGLGVLSYSVYIWQQLFLNWINTGWWVCRWPVNLLCVGLAATASYFLIESPFLRLKDRWRR